MVNDPSAVAAPISYTTNYSGENITNGSIPDINVPMTTIDLPAVDSDVNVFVTAMNVFGSGPSSNIVLDEISELHTACIYLCMYVRTYILEVCMYVHTYLKYVCTYIHTC